MQQETYYTVERICSPVGQAGQEAQYRLTYRREWMEERQLWRDTLVSQERLQ